MDVKLKPADPGYYQAPAQSLPAEREWWLQLDARVGEFDQFSGKRTFEVRGSD